MKKERIETTSKYRKALTTFLQLLTVREIARMKRDYPKSLPSTFTTHEGLVYDKVIMNSHGSRSSYCYIHRETGDIYKGNWKGVVKPLIARGNIFGTNPIEGTTEYGVIYLNGPARWRTTAI